MIDKTDLLILSHLRQEGRKTLTALSKATNVPISTIFERLKHQREYLVKKFTALLDFQKLGFYTRAEIMFKVKKADREQFQKYVIGHRHVNSCFRINNGYDYLVEGIFQNIKDMEEFLEYIDETFSVEKKQLYFIIDVLKEEDFLSSPENLKLLGIG